MAKDNFGYDPKNPLQVAYTGTKDPSAASTGNQPAGAALPPPPKPLTAQEYMAAHPNTSGSMMGIGNAQGLVDQQNAAAQAEYAKQNIANNPPTLAPSKESAQNTMQTPQNQAVTAQTAAANQFMKNMPSIVDNQVQSAATDARNQVAQGVAANNTGYNQRGLLYSGMRAGGANDVGNVIGNQLEQKKAGINKNAFDTSNALNQNSINAGQAANQLQSGYNAADNATTQAILQYLQDRSGNQNAAYQHLLGAGGGLLGQAAGGMFAPKGNYGTALSDSIANYQLPTYQPQFSGK